MLTETTRKWLSDQWGTINPIRIDSSTAWDILIEGKTKQEAREVWNEYAQAKRLPEHVDAVNQIHSYDDLVSWVYVKRLRW